MYVYKYLRSILIESTCVFYLIIKGPYIVLKQIVPTRDKLI